MRKIVPHVFQAEQALRSDVWNQDITFGKGHLYLLEAQSGKGKSTFCSYLIGHRHDFGGQLFFDRQDVANLGISDWSEVRKRHISCLFQDLRLFPEFTALENVLIKNKLTHFTSEAQVVGWFEELGIADKLNERVARLSYGQQQRVALARALAQPFDFLLADEPVSHLDDANGKAMGDIMLREARRQGAGVIVTSIGKHMDLSYERVVRL